jgi:hypothetical protein
MNEGDVVLELSWVQWGGLMCVASAMVALFKDDGLLAVALVLLGAACLL